MWISVNAKGRRPKMLRQPLSWNWTDVFHFPQNRFCCISISSPQVRRSASRERGRKKWVKQQFVVISCLIERKSVTFPHTVHVSRFGKSRRHSFRCVRVRARRESPAYTCSTEPPPKSVWIPHFSFLLFCNTVSTAHLLLQARRTPLKRVR